MTPDLETDCKSVHLPLIYGLCLYNALICTDLSFLAIIFPLFQFEVGLGLTISLTTNSLPFLTERVCRQQV